MSGPSKRGRPRSLIPAYRLHKASGQAVVTIRGKTFYLGPFESAESRVKYGRLIADLASGLSIDAADQTSPSANSSDQSLSIAELCDDFLDFAESHYVKHGRQTDEVRCYKSLIRVWSTSYGLTPLHEFGPNQLRAVRDAMIAKSWTRGYINRQVNRLRHMVKWAVGRRTD